MTASTTSTPSRTPTARSERQFPSRIVSPALQFGTAAVKAGGSPGVPSSSTRDPLFTELLRKFADTDYDCRAGIKWKDDDKLGSLSIMRFATAAGAHKGITAFRTFAHGWGENGG